jgi:predicted ester cyclase
MLHRLRSGVFALLGVALLLALVPAPVIRAQDATPEAECVTTTAEENKEIVTQYWAEAVWGAQGTIDELVAEDEVHHWGIQGDTTDLAAFNERWGLFLAAFPDLRFTVDQVAAEGDLAATLWTATGTQSGEWQGIAPTGKEVSWTGINVFRIECGKIAESWGEADHLTLRRELGATDVPDLGGGMAAATPEMTDMAASTPCADDSPEANIAIARRQVEEATNGKDLAVFDEILDPAIVHHGAMFPDAHGIDAVKNAFSNIFTAFPDIDLTVDATIADGDLTVVRWSGTGTQDGPYLGLEPTGTEVTFSGVNIQRLSCGRIVETWSEMNGLDVYQQLAG